MSETQTNPPSTPDPNAPAATDPNVNPDTGTDTETSSQDGQTPPPSVVEENPQPARDLSGFDPKSVPPAPDHFEAGVASRMRHMFNRAVHGVEAKIEAAIREELANIPTDFLPDVAVRYRDELLAHLDAAIAKNQQAAS
jgi:hypothetical protein